MEHQKLNGVSDRTTLREFKELMEKKWLPAIPPGRPF
jgi:hypothetical protein